MTPCPATCHVRKIHRAGRSLAVVIPPAALAHINADFHSYLYFSTEAPGFLILHVAPVPPNYTNAELFTPQPAAAPPEPADDAVPSTPAPDAPAPEN